MGHSGVLFAGSVGGMFRHAKVPWELLLQMSVQVLLKRYGITAGVLVVDDSDKRRAKVSRRLAHVLGPFNRAVYRTRNRIERLINRCKQFRRLAIRYEKRAVNYRAMWLIAVCLLWL